MTRTHHETLPPFEADHAQAGNGSAPKGRRKHGAAHWIALVRTGIYSAVATAFFIAIGIGGAWLFFLPGERVRGAMRFWTRSDLWLLRVIAGQSFEVRGAANIPTGAAIVAAKHHSAWETMALFPILPDAIIILKKELLHIPLYGWYARRGGMVSIDRKAGASALKKLAIDAGAAMEDRAQLVIFPEGTRRSVGAPPDYKPGAIFLYQSLGVPMVPVALNSGVLWPRRRFVRYPGTVIVSFLPPIPPGLPRTEAKRRLVEAVEAETARLVAEADPSQAYVPAPGEPKHAGPNRASV